MKICSECKISKENTAFSPSGGGLKNLCKKCNCIRAKRWREKNPEKVSAGNKNWRIKYPDRARKNDLKQSLKKSYGLTVGQWESLFIAQEGKCKICGKKPPKLQVDHCHNTGKVRGLLCGPCNRGLEGFKDSSKALLAAIAYLDTP